MNFIKINPCDMVNGDGLRVSLWVAGCPHKCKGCHNPEAFNADAGEEFTHSTYMKILELLDTGIKKNLSILGGEPLAKYNYDQVLHICKAIKEDRPTTNIHLWSGYYYDEIVERGQEKIFDYIDVLIDGRYDEDLKVEGKPYGSSNQRMWEF